MENKIRNCSSHSLIAIGERSSSIERGGGGDFVKICEKFQGPTFWDLEIPYPNRNHNINFMLQQNELLFLWDNKNQV